MPSPDIKYSPAYIKQCANTILDKIYPTVWASYKMTQTEVDAVKDRALMSFYQSDVMDHAVSFAFTCHGLTEAAHGLIRTYGVGNIRHPNVFAVAAMAVSLFIPFIDRISYYLSWTLGRDGATSSSEFG